MAPRNEDLPLAVEIQRTEESLHIYDGLLRALREPHAMLDVVLQADDGDAARAALGERFGLDDVQATAVVDRQFRGSTLRARRRIEEQRQELADHLSYLKDLDER